MDDGEKNTKGGWGAWRAFQNGKDVHGDSTRSFSIFTIFFILLALVGLGYYTYYQVQGATGTRLYVGTAATSTLATSTINVTTTPDALQSGLVSHLTFDGMDMDWTSTTAEVVELTTKPADDAPTFACGTDTVSDADANVYDTVQVGTQCWMAQNLRVGTRIAAATAQTDNGTIEKYCYSNSDANCTANNPNEPDGGLYQWNEAMQYSTTPGAQGICPAGWHIPTHDELTTMERAICTSGSCATDFPYDTTTTGYRGTNEGTKLKAGGSSGLEFSLAGIVVSGSSLFRGVYGYWWSSSPSGGFAWSRGSSFPVRRESTALPFPRRSASPSVVSRILLLRHF